MERSILVGVDGSEAGFRAVLWAAHEADRRGHRLVLLSSMEVPADVAAFAWPEQEVRKDALAAVKEAERRARAVAPGLDVASTVVADAPAPALTGPGADTSMVVVGLRGRGGFPGMRIGSVAYHVAAHSPVPVVIVGPDPAAEASPEVVVGVCGSPNADHPLAAAFEAATLGGSPVRTVWAWTPPPRRSPELDVYAEAIRKGAESGATEALRPWLAKYPDVKVAFEIVESQPVLALTRAASRAHLIVVGARSREVLPRLALGGVAHGLLHHAPCPVMIVH
ncbi:universal stress protein [Allosalinactinospora lopnorensis]|uniref:universal stress protein n=1 Tax=Allosalinactinospora lopnorensis TaxID=1352348 RepID=UPI000623DB10|nr:universal stress protein [Allosalinactinospora lopnorensis]